MMMRDVIPCTGNRPRALAALSRYMWSRLRHLGLLRRMAGAEVIAAGIAFIYYALIRATIRSDSLYPVVACCTTGFLWLSATI